MRRLTVVAAAALALAACQDGPVSPGAEQPRFTTHTEYAFFHWLPPISKTTGEFGVFNPDVYPRVTVCQIPKDGAAGCIAGTEVDFWRGAPSSGEQVEMIEAQELYQANWKTPSVTTDTWYQVAVYRTVSPESPPLGPVIKLLLRSGGSIETVDGNVVRNSGATLPIKFRLDKQCGDDCVETWVGEEEVALILPNVAAAYLPEDEERTVDFRLVITQYEGPGPCLPLPHPQYQGCYTVEAFDLLGNPYAPTFGSEADDDDKYMTFVPCLSPTAESLRSELSVWKWNRKAWPASETKKLEFVDVPESLAAFSCIGYEDVAEPGAGGSAGVLGSLRGPFALVGTLLRPLAWALAPSPAWARSLTQGTKVRDRSRIGWVHELAIEKTAGDNQTVAAGQVVPIQPQVRVTSAETGRGINGVPITFANGSGFTFSTTTNGAGYASAQGWAVGSTPDAYTVTAHAYNYVDTWVNQKGAQWAPFGGVVPGNALTIPAADVTFTATVPSYTVTMLTPLGTVSSAPNLVLNPAPEVRVCRKPCAGPGDDLHSPSPATATLQSSKGETWYQFNWQSPSASTTNPAGPNYEVRVLLNGAELYRRDITGVSSGSKARNPFEFEMGRTIPVKFTIR
jgi:hypothetical protein